MGWARLPCWHRLSPARAVPCTTPTVSPWSRAGDIPKHRTELPTPRRCLPDPQEGGFVGSTPTWERNLQLRGEGRG